MKPACSREQVRRTRGHRRRLWLTVTITLAVLAGSSAWAAASSTVAKADAVRDPSPINIDRVANAQYGNDAAWYEQNIPFIDLPGDSSGKAIESAYYYRWNDLKQHLQPATQGTVISEFKPHVSWANDDNSIDAASGFQAGEAMWLKDQSYVDDDFAFYLGGNGNSEQYSNWLANTMWQDYELTGNPSVALAHLPALEKEITAWTNSNYNASHSLYVINDASDASEHSVVADDEDQFGVTAFRPTINSYLYSDMEVASEIAGLGGQSKVAQQYSTKAAALKTQLLTSLWNPKTDMFQDRYDGAYSGDNILGQQMNVKDFQFDTAPELAGYAPFMFNIPGSSYDVAFEHLLNSTEFAGTYGLRTIYKTNPYYDPQGLSAPGQNNWDGPSWPYATSEVLIGLANVLNQGIPKNSQGSAIISTSDYDALLTQYARQQTTDTAPNKAGQPAAGVQEQMDPDTGVWTVGVPDRSEDYLHSAYDDLVLNGLLGIRPSTGDTLTIHPLVPSSWSHFAIQNLSYHGHDLTVIYDKTGSYYHDGSGLRVWVDGTLVGSGNLSGLTVNVGAPVLPSADSYTTSKLINYAYQDPGTGTGATAVASSSASVSNVVPWSQDGTPGPTVTETTSTSTANDGQIWYDGSLPLHRWQSATSDTAPYYEVDYQSPHTISEVIANVYSDASVPAPSGYSVQYSSDGSAWAAVPDPSGTATLTGNTANVIGFTPVLAEKVRINLTPAASGDAVALAQFQTLGPSNSVPDNVTAYPAASAAVNDANVDSSEYATDGQYVGQINNADSTVTFDNVVAPSAGTYTLDIRYANGYTNDEPATQFLSVNGVAADPVSYPWTGGWTVAGGLAIATTDVTLNQGNNTLAFTHDTNFAELDSIWLSPATTKTSVRSSDHGTGRAASRVTYTATVRAADTSISAKTNIPVGSVSFADTSGLITGCTNVPLSATGTATCSATNSARARTAHITVVYAGDDGYAPSVSVTSG
jgi:F5/8 type C domain/Carbohydrate binding module (family 35)